MRSRRLVAAVTIGLATLAVLLLASPIDFAAARYLPRCVAQCESALPPDEVLVLQATAVQTATVRATVQATLTLSTGTPITYVVKTGDTFNAIAKRFNLTPAELSALNQLTNTSVLEVGQVLVVGVLAFTPTPAPTSTPQPTQTTLPTASATTTPSPSLTATLPASPVPESTNVSPTLTPTANAPIRSEPPRSSGVPIDVYLVAGLMVLAIIGIIIGFKTQNR